jgi:GT2 family glycosyltransferase
LNKKIGIVILNWNNYVDTKKCLNSLLLSDNINCYDLEIFLIDNNSQDGSGDKLKTEFNNIVHFYNTGKNKGYTGGNNFGIRKAIKYNCDYILILNNDLYIKNFYLLIENIYKIFQYDNKIGIVGFEIFNLETKEKIIEKNISDKFFNKLLKIDDRPIKIDDNLITSERNVCGCAICFKSECIEDIGFFDENFFMYAEEQDICLRAIKNNWKIFKVKNKNFAIYRKVIPTSNNKLIWYYGTRNIFYAYKNNLNRKNYYLFSTIQLLIYFKQIIRYSLYNNKEISFNIFLGILDYIKDKKGKLHEN